MFNGVSTRGEVRPFTHVVRLRILTETQNRLIGTHDDVGVVLIGRHTHDIENVRAEPRIHRRVNLRREVVVQEPEVVLRSDHVFAADLGEGVQLRVNPLHLAFARNREHTVHGHRGVGRIVLKGKTQLRSVVTIGEIRFLHVALTEEVDAAPHALPADQVTYFGLKEKRQGSPWPQ